MRATAIAVALERLVLVEPDAPRDAADEAAHEHVRREPVGLTGLEPLEDPDLDLGDARDLFEAHAALRATGAKPQRERHPRIDDRAGAWAGRTSAAKHLVQIGIGSAFHYSLLRTPTGWL